jgi:hypothetical protein
MNLVCRFIEVCSFARSEVCPKAAIIRVPNIQKYWVRNIPGNSHIQIEFSCWRRAKPLKEFQASGEGVPV